MESQLRASELRYRRLFEAAKDGILILNAETGMIDDANPFLINLLGLTKAELLQKRVWELGSFHHLIANLEKFTELKRNNYVRYEDLPLVSADGRLIDVEFVSNVYQVEGVAVIQCNIRDITERRRAAVALRESEERFQLVSRAVSDVIWDWNLSTNALWWGGGFLSTFGYTSADIEHGIESWTSRIHPEDRERVTKSIRAAIDTGLESWSAEYRFLCKDGTHAVVQDCGYILRDSATGRGLRMVGGMRDLTEQKKNEAQYLRPQRMESIGTLAGGIAHDLNNVLAPIMMSIELLKTEAGKNSPRSDILDIIHNSCRRGADLVRQVLSFARGLEGQRIVIRLNHLIEDLRRITRETFPSNIHIICRVPVELWPVVGDPTQLHQVLLNLAINARDAMPEGGTLSVCASNILLDARHIATSREIKPGAFVLLKVSDTGCGIPPAVLERIFEPFFTTKDFGQGTGLGLSIVDTIIKGHGGFVLVESKVGKGTCFKVHLPADPARLSSEPVSSVRDMHALPRGRDELVLVIDDEASIRGITLRTLKAFDYRVMVAANGAEGVALYTEHWKKISLVLTDMMMPVMDGAATIRALLQVNPAARIIAASGLDVADNIAKAVRAGVPDFLPKPYEAETLLRRIREVLDRPARVDS